MRPDLLEALAGFLDNGAVFDGDLAYADSRRCADAIAWEAVLSAVLSAPMSATRRGDSAHNARREGPQRPVAHHVV